MVNTWRTIRRAVVLTPTKAADLVLSATVAWSVFALGCTLGWSVVGLGALAYLLCVVNICAGRFRVDVGVAVLATLATLTTLQSVTLPWGVVAFLDADLAATWKQTLLLLGDASHASLSLEPLTTRLEAVKLFAYAAVWGCVAGRRQVADADTLVRWVLALLVVLVATTLVHRAAGWPRVFMLYEPQHVRPYWIGPLLNPNNLGGACNLGVFVALSLALRASLPAKAWGPYMGLAAGLACMTVLTGSRGAVAALLIGATIFTWVSWRRRSQVPRARWVILVAVAAAGLMTALVVEEERLLHELGNWSTDKLQLMGSALKVLKHHAVFGVGRGALGAEITTVHRGLASLVFPYAECFPLDWGTGWGIPVAVVLLALTAWAVLKPRGGVRTNTLRLAVVVVLIQNLFDLGFEVPGLVVPWLVVLAVFWTSTAPPGWGHYPAKASAVGVVTLGMAGLVALGIPWRSTSEVRNDVSKSLQSNPARDPAELRAALATNPGDPHLLRLAGVNAALKREPKALSWINAALLRAPHQALTYLVLAEALWLQGAQQQAVGALRRAAEDPTLHGEVLDWIFSRQANVLVAAAPTGHVGAQLLVRAAARVRDQELTRQILVAARERAPDSAEVSIHVLEWQVGVWLRGQDPACDDVRRCLADLGRELDAVERSVISPQDRRRVRVMQARLRSLQGDTPGAFTALIHDCDLVPSDLMCAQVLLEFGKTLGGEELETSAVRYLNLVCERASVCLSERLAVAANLVQAGRLTAALHQYARATAFGTEPQAFLGASEVAAALGREQEALYWVTKGERLFRSDPLLNAQKERLAGASR